MLRNGLGLGLGRKRTKIEGYGGGIKGVNKEYQEHPGWWVVVRLISSGTVVVVYYLVARGEGGEGQCHLKMRDGQN